MQELQAVKPHRRWRRILRPRARILPRRLVRIAFILLALLVLLLMLLAHARRPRYSGPLSDHFDGRRFRNEVTSEHGLGDFLRWRLGARPAAWPEHVAYPPGEKPATRLGTDDWRVTWINHATVLLQVGGLNLLTDPIWSERCSPVSWAGPKRAIDPGIRFKDLPPIDVVLLSHNHYDHLDFATLRRLEENHQPLVLTGLGNGSLVRRTGIERVAELDWWEAVELPEGMRARFVPAQHFSARTMFDRDTTLWGGFVIETGAGAIYFAGDTGYGPHFGSIAERYPEGFRLALLPIGAYEPRWFMQSAHMDPEEAVEAHKAVRAARSLGIHWGTFQLTDEAREEPVERLMAALASQGVDENHFWAFTPGETRAIP